MKCLLSIVVVLVATKVFGQCPYPVKLSSSGICPGAVLTVTASKNIAKIDWLRDGVVVSTTTATMNYDPVGITVAGGNAIGSEAYRLNYPQGLYVDAEGNVIVADQDNQRIQAWPIGATSGTTIATNFWTSQDPMRFPQDVMPDKDGNLYISNYKDNRIEKWAPGSSGGVVVAGGNGMGYRANQLDNPAGIFLDNNGNLYVADQNNDRVQRFALGSTTGVTVAGGNGPGKNANQLYNPTDMFVDKAGNVYVADRRNHRIQKWAPGAITGVTVAGNPNNPLGDAGLQFPYSLYIDGVGNMFIADAVNNRIQLWKPGASSGVTIAGSIGIGSAPTKLNEPRYLWADANDNVYVSDQRNHRVQKFTLQNDIDNTFITPSPGKYTAVVTFYTGCTATTNSITIQGAGSPAISIAASANPINSCTNVAFTATTTEAGTNPAFQWQVNGVNAGANQPSFQTGALQNGDVVSCILTTIDACISNMAVSSNAVTVGVNGLPPATIINKGVFCPGDTLTIKSVDSLSKIVWLEGTSPVKTVTARPPGSAITVAGGNGQGPGANQLHLPVGAVVDAQGNIYIADLSNNRVMKWSPAASSGTSVTTIQLSGYTSVAVDKAGNIYIVVSKSTVMKFPPAGGSNGVVVAGGNGEGSNANQLKNAVFLFVDDVGNLYVADDDNARVQKWAPGATSGVTVAGGNGVGLANNQIVPTSFFVDKAGNIFIADSFNNRVVKWAAGTTSGIEILGSSDINFGPRGIWVDEAGNLYLTSRDDQSVKMFAPDSKVGVTIAGGHGAGSSADQFDSPGSIFMDAAGYLYISDFLNNRVQKILKRSTIDSTYIATAAGTYTAEVTTSGGCVIGTNSILVKPNLTPTVFVVSPGAQACEGTQVTFTATPSNEGTAPVYAWQINGVNAGGTGQSFTMTLSKGLNTVICRMISNAACVLPATASSGPLTINAGAAVTPSVSISTSSTNICAGTTATFVATPVHGGANPVIQWTVNGNAVGSNSLQFGSSNLKDGDVVACRLTSDAVCAIPSIVPSNNIRMRVQSVVPPVVMVTADPDRVCSGLPVTFSAQVTGGGNSPRYQWQVNGINAGVNRAVFTTAELADGDAVSCTVSANNGCALGFSSNINMDVKPTPFIAPNQVFTSTVNGVTLTPEVSGTIASWNWSPAAGLSAADVPNPVASPVITKKHRLTVVSDDGCSASEIITVQVFSEIKVPNAFSPNGDGKNDVFYILVAPKGSSVKNFAVFNRWGMKVFNADEVVVGEPAFGWNGTIRNVAAEAGSYVYSFSVHIGGEVKVFRGVVMLVR